jgi:hypothetical protein
MRHFWSGVLAARLLQHADPSCNGHRRVPMRRSIRQSLKRIEIEEP